MQLSNYPIDFVIIALVLLAGQFQKKYCADFLPRMSGAWKTLLASFGFTLIYGALVYHAGSFTKDLPQKWFFSYVVATSLYELLFKKLLAKFFPDDCAKAIILLIICSAVLSCNTVKKTSHSATAKDSVAQAFHFDSGRIATTSANSVNSSDSVAFIKNIALLQSSLRLVFDSSSASITTPIIIATEDGKTSVDVGGRALQSLDFKSNNQKQTTDSNSVKKAQNQTAVTADSSYQHADVSRTETKTEVENDSAKTSMRFPIIIVGIIAIVVAGAIFYTIHKHNL